MKSLDLSKDQLEVIEKTVIESRIRSHSDNLQAAAKSLGISRSTIYRKVKLYKIGVRDVSRGANESF